MTEEAVCLPPEAHHNQDHGQGNQLAHLYADIEREQIRNQTIRGDVVFDNLRREAKTVEQTKDQGGDFGIGLKAKPALICTQVIQRLLHHR